MAAPLRFVEEVLITTAYADSAAPPVSMALPAEPGSWDLIGFQAEVGMLAS
jgi:hypothetical protein